MLKKPIFHCSFLFIFVCALLANASLAATENMLPYKMGSVIDADISIQDVRGKEVSLVDLIRSQDKPFSVVYVFGGGAMGAESIQRGIWCQDSYEDLHILRSLVDRYKDRVGFIAIAEPPVFHTKQMGHVHRALLDYTPDESAYETAGAAFIESTQEAVNKGTIPIQPYYDVGFRFLMSKKQQSNLKPAYGDVPVWQGAFRMPDDRQTYGVPALWLVDQQGKVLTKPFRGNIYHPHGTDDITLNYSLSDVLNVVDEYLK